MEDRKSQIRKAGFAARKIAHANALTATPLATTHLIAAIGDVPRNQIVAGYMPIRTEIDVLPAMQALHDKAIRLCVPVIERANQPLVFREWHPDWPMEEGAFGAQIPSKGGYFVPDILIVPLVAFDARLNRMGYGGGFYDRTLHAMRNRDPRYTSRLSPPTRAIGFAYAGQELPTIPQERTDEPLDMIVTENGVLTPKARS